MEDKAAAASAETDATDKGQLRSELLSLLAHDPRAVNLVLENVFDGVWFWDLKDLSRQFFGPKFWAMLGLTEAPAEQRNWQRLVHPEDREKLYSSIERHMRKPDESIDEIIRYRSSADNWIHVRTRGMIMLDENDRPARLLVLNIDVSDNIAFEIAAQESQKELEQALREKQTSEEELKFIFNAMPLQVFYKDDKNRILRANKLAANNLGMHPDDLQGADTYELFPEMAEKYFLDDKKVIDSGVPELGIVEAYAPKDRPTGWVQTDKIPMRLSNGSSTLLVVASDITELKEQAAQLEQLSEASKQFAAIAAHDLRGPLRQVRAMVEMVSEEIESADFKFTDDGQFAFEHISLSLERMEKMVADLHMLSKLESHKIDIEPVDLNIVLRRLSNQKKVLLEEANAELVVPDLPVVFGSERLIEYIFSNLIRNACNFRRGDKVRMSVSSELDVPRQRLKFYFSDDGIGIPESQHSKVFAPFTRLESGKSGDGTGLGLAIVSRVMTAHGGQVFIDPEYKSGARFVLEFPIAGVERSDTRLERSAG
jgi:PAS domain S-box-containing protein